MYYLQAVEWHCLIWCPKLPFINTLILSFLKRIFQMLLIQENISHDRQLISDSKTNRNPNGSQHIHWKISHCEVPGISVRQQIPAVPSSCPGRRTWNSERGRFEITYTRISCHLLYFLRWCDWLGRWGESHGCCLPWLQQGFQHGLP